MSALCLLVLAASAILADANDCQKERRCKRKLNRILHVLKEANLVCGTEEAATIGGRSFCCANLFKLYFINRVTIGNHTSAVAKKKHREGTC